MLRKDGTVWLNLGSSYSGSGMQSSNPGGKTEKQVTNQGSFSVGFGGISTNQSHRVQHESACDNDGKERLNLKESDRVCSHSDGEHQDDFQNHHDCISRNSQEHQQASSHSSRKDHDNGHSDCAEEPLCSSPPYVQESTKPGFWMQLRDGCLHSGNPFSCPSFSCSCFPAIQGSEHKKVSLSSSQIFSDAKKDLSKNIHDNGEIAGALGHHKKGMVSDCFSLAEPPKVQAYHNIKFKAKDLISIPWMVALALQADGWWLRSDIIWAKPNPMPESIQDRPTKAHEYIFLLTKNSRYFYDAEAIKEKSIYPLDNRKERSRKTPDGWDTGDGGHGSFHRKGREKGQKRYPTDKIAGIREGSANYPIRNKRSVWTIATQPFPEAHFATFPEEIPRTCILAGCPEGGTVLDPFVGSGRTLTVAKKLRRKAIGVELNPDYCEMPANDLAQEVLPFNQ